MSGTEATLDKVCGTKEDRRQNVDDFRSVEQNHARSEGKKKGGFGVITREESVENLGLRYRIRETMTSDGGSE